MEDVDPVMARDLAASVVKEFMRENFSQRASVNRVASEFLQEEAEKLKRKLEESESKLQHYKEQNQAVCSRSARISSSSVYGNLAPKSQVPKGSDFAWSRTSSKCALQVRTISTSYCASRAFPKFLKSPSIASSCWMRRPSLPPWQDRYGSLHPKYIATATRIESLKQALRENVGKAGDILNGQYEAAVQTETKLHHWP
jgi:hypothetical protein